MTLFLHFHEQTVRQVNIKKDVNPVIELCFQENIVPDCFIDLVFEGLDIVLRTNHIFQYFTEYRDHRMIIKHFEIFTVKKLGYIQTK